MAGRKATILIAQVARGEYIVDADAVAEAIVRRRLAHRRGLRMLEAGQSLDEGPVGADDDNGLAATDLP
jgi:hypothetical protein